MTSKVEQYINDYTRKCSNELCSIEDRYGKTVISYHEWLTPDQALRAAEIAKEETIEKACEWLESVNLDWYQIREGIFSTQLIEDFRKAMED